MESNSILWKSASGPESIPYFTRRLCSKSVWKNDVTEHFGIGFKLTEMLHSKGCWGLSTGAHSAEQRVDTRIGRSECSFFQFWTYWITAIAFLIYLSTNFSHDVVLKFKKKQSRTLCQVMRWTELTFCWDDGEEGSKCEVRQNVCRSMNEISNL
jgi:hypothetical protein